MAKKKTAKTLPGNPSTPDDITFNDLFELPFIQRIQDEFSTATGVASIITLPDGTPITQPSNFCRLCDTIIRCTETGRRNCYHSDSIIGRHHKDAPIVQQCLSGGLWDAGASITVGNRHIANWLIGQVRDETQSEQKMLEYARTIGADETAVLEAFREVPSMSLEHFQQIARWLFTLANQLSTSAYQNIQQARLITERQRAEEMLRESENAVRNKLNAIVEPKGDIGTLNLSDIIDSEALQSMMDDFHRLTSLTCAILDISGKVLVAAGWQDICTKFHRCHPDTLKNCLESDTILSSDIPEGIFKTYLCKNNLQDMATPIMVAGRHVGNFFIGQFFYDDEIPDMDLFRDQARRYGFDEKEYLAAFDRVPRLSREKAKAAMAFYAKLAAMIAKLSYSTIRLSRTLAERRRNEEINASRMYLLQFSATHSLNELLEETLNEAEKLIDSRIGFYHFVDDDQQSLTLQNWSTRTKAEFCKAARSGLHYDIDNAGVWVDCVYQRQPVIHNDYASLPHRKGMPEGHAEVIRELVVPVIRGEKVVAILGVGNKPTDYTQKDIETLSLLADLAWESAERIRVEEAIRELNVTLEQRVTTRTEELTVAMEKAQDADHLKSAFLATMSHELRTPLNSIIGFTGILLQRMPGPLNEEQTKQMNMIQESANHLLALINDVLDISKIEAGQLDIVKEPFDMRLVVEDVLQTVMPLAVKKGLLLSASLESAVGCMTSDQRRVKQILINLTINAVKFTEHGDVQIDCRINEDRLEIRVRDTGIGIAQQDMDKLFKTFQQIDCGLTRNHEGTGLGLSISKKLVEMLGGLIAVESEPGIGSTFMFTLPVVGAESGAAREDI